MAVVAVALVSLVGCDSESPDRMVDGWFTTSDGVRLHYLERAGEGSPVVLLHGYMGSAASAWVAPGFVDALGARHRVILLDQRAHGESDAPHEPSAYGERMVTDVIELMDTLGIEKAHIGGYSMGGSMTLRLMQRVPERFLSAHVGGAGVDEQDDALRAAALARDPQGTDPEEAWMLEEIERSNANTPPPDRVAHAALVEAWGAWTRVDPDLSRVAFPVLCVNGGFDGPYSKSARMARELPRVENVVVLGRSHLTTLIDPLYHESLASFFSRYDAP
ncbi:Alpha/beta hydrolase fold protein [Myxococcus hansupus]|uniref:Alpha/beta hydrolase fold protein n=1 Tax=Pseudomyxococcus hansupus TaxID=1297742 RepID=A0A0H4WYE7_9BACT|nr:Alpha/beta hydrolase fold protein [Myxococcus hansupus]